MPKEISLHELDEIEAIGEQPHDGEWFHFGGESFDTLMRVFVFQTLAGGIARCQRNHNVKNNGKKQCFPRYNNVGNAKQEGS